MNMTYEVPDGTAGECIVRASVPWVMNAGYLNNDAATEPRGATDGSIRVMRSSAPPTANTCSSTG